MKLPNSFDAIRSHYEEILTRHGICHTCHKMYDHEYTAPFASCDCGTSEWHTLTPYMESQKTVHHQQLHIAQLESRTAIDTTKLRPNTIQYLNALIRMITFRDSRLGLPEREDEKWDVCIDDQFNAYIKYRMLIPDEEVVNFDCGMYKVDAEEFCKIFNRQEPIK